VSHSLWLTWLSLGVGIILAALQVLFPNPILFWLFLAIGLVVVAAATAYWVPVFPLGGQVLSKMKAVIKHVMVDTVAGFGLAAVVLSGVVLLAFSFYRQNTTVPPAPNPQHVEQPPSRERDWTRTIVFPANQTPQQTGPQDTLQKERPKKRLNDSARQSQERSALPRRCSCPPNGGGPGMCNQPWTVDEARLCLQ
jgi:hypothetical protein